MDTRYTVISSLYITVIWIHRYTCVNCFCIPVSWITIHIIWIIAAWIFLYSRYMTVSRY